MSTEIDIVLGLGIMSALFSYFAFEFLHRENHEEGEHHEEKKGGLRWENIIGVMCFILAIVFLNMLMYSLVLIAQNTGISYFNDTILVVGMQIVMWATLSGIALYLLVLTLGSLYFIYDTVMVWWKGRGKGEVV